MLKFKYLLQFAIFILIPSLATGQNINIKIFNKTGYDLDSVSFDHFYLGNTLRGFKYLFTFNEVYAGWLLDLFELHVLLQRSVQEYGNVKAPFWCTCCNES
jgi:Mn2+/Fe2+ NRAMP family transporter